MPPQNPATIARSVFTVLWSHKSNIQESPTFHSQGPPKEMEKRRMSSNKKKWAKVYKRNERIVSRKIADEILLVPVRGHLADMQRLFSLNPVAEHIWEQLDGEKSIEGIRCSVLDKYDVESDQADVDIAEFIDKLLDADLIVEVE
jgi:hypothetical protein